jgi:hypothetical protein
MTGEEFFECLARSALEVDHPGFVGWHGSIVLNG